MVEHQSIHTDEKPYLYGQSHPCRKMFRFLVVMKVEWSDLWVAAVFIEKRAAI